MGQREFSTLLRGLSPEAIFWHRLEAEPKVAVTADDIAALSPRPPGVEG